MKVVFVTQEDPIYILPFFDEFFRQNLSGVDVLGVFCCRTMGDRDRGQLFRALWCLYGTSGLLRLLARRALSTLLQYLPARRNARRFYSVGQICRTFGLAHEPIGDPNREVFRSRIAELSPDLIVSIACPYIFGKKLLSLPPLGCINVHHAPLPRYRGMMPTFWQMYRREKNVGLTIHTMTERVDGGTALLQERIAIGDGESLDALMRRTKRHAARRTLGVVRQLAQQTQTGWSLGAEEGSYFTFPTPAQMRDFRRCGFRAI